MLTCDLTEFKCYSNLCKKILAAAIIAYHDSIATKLCNKNSANSFWRFIKNKMHNQADIIGISQSSVAKYNVYPTTASLNNADIVHDNSIIANAFNNYFLANFNKTTVQELPCDTKALQHAEDTIREIKVSEVTAAIKQLK